MTHNANNLRATGIGSGNHRDNHRPLSDRWTDVFSQAPETNAWNGQTEELRTISGSYRYGYLPPLAINQKLTAGNVQNTGTIRVQPSRTADKYKKSIALPNIPKSPNPTVAQQNTGPDKISERMKRLDEIAERIHLHKESQEKLESAQLDEYQYLDHMRIMCTDLRRETVRSKQLIAELSAQNLDVSSVLEEMRRAKAQLDLRFNLMRRNKQLMKVRCQKMELEFTNNPSLNEPVMESMSYTSSALTAFHSNSVANETGCARIEAISQNNNNTSPAVREFVTSSSRTVQESARISNTNPTVTAIIPNTRTPLPESLKGSNTSPTVTALARISNKSPTWTESAKIPNKTPTWTEYATIPNTCTPLTESSRIPSASPAVTEFAKISNTNPTVSMVRGCVRISNTTTTATEPAIISSTKLTGSKLGTVLLPQSHSPTGCGSTVGHGIDSSVESSTPKGIQTGVAKPCIVQTNEVPEPKFRKSSRIKSPFRMLFSACTGSIQGEDYCNRSSKRNASPFQYIKRKSAKFMKKLRGRNRVDPSDDQV